MYVSLPEKNVQVAEPQMTSSGFYFPILSKVMLFKAIRLKEENCAYWDYPNRTNESTIYFPFGTLGFGTGGLDLYR